MYQQEVVALISASGARVSILHPHRLVALWQLYSQRQYLCSWMEPDREEVFRFVTWSNGQRGLPSEIAARVRARNLERLRVVAKARQRREDPRGQNRVRR